MADAATAAPTAAAAAEYAAIQSELTTRSDAAESAAAAASSSAAANVVAASSSAAAAAAASSPAAAGGRDEHTESCIMCGGIGELLCCDSCPLVYHLSCVGKRRVPEGLWECPVCLNQATLQQFRVQRQEARARARQRERQRHERKQYSTRSGAQAGTAYNSEDDDEAEDGAGMDDDSDVLSCAFCHKPELTFSSGVERPLSHDPAVVEDLLVGPYYELDRKTGRRTAELWVHKSCALWSPRVFMVGKRMENVVLEIQRARWLNCAECHKRGASIGCFDRDCDKTYHYKCALDTARACMLMPSYKLFCTDHAIKRNLTEVIALPPELAKIRIDNVQAHMALKQGGAAAAATHGAVGIGDKRRIEQGFYKSEEVYSAFLARATAARAAKAAPFAHLSHLPEQERKRRRKIEALIPTLDEQEAQRKADAKHAAKRKLRAMTDEERQPEEAKLERQRLKEAEDAKAIAEMNAASDPAVASTAAAASSIPAASAAAVPAPAPSAAAADPWSLVGGLDAHIASLKECVLLPLLYPEIFEAKHIVPPKGVMLVGGPGTGKTLLARSLARACTQLGSTGRPVAFFARSGADVLSRYHGDAEMTLRALFEKAERLAPSIIYFDEVDGLAPVRSAKQNQVHASVVTTLLSLIDGIDARRSGVFVLASTNRVDAVDPALRRPGRFDRELVVGLPGLEQRQEILRIHTRQWPEASQVDAAQIQQIATQTVGFSGADLRALCNEAAMFAAHRAIGPSLLPRDSPSSSLLQTRRDAAVVAGLSTVRVEPSDFQDALSKVTSSVRRHADAPDFTPSAPMTALLAAKLREAQSVLDLPASVLGRKADADSQLIRMDDEPDAAATPLLSLPSTVHRLLICDTDPPPLSRTTTDAEGHPVQQPWIVSLANPNTSLLASALLSSLDLEGCTVRRLDIPSLLCDADALTLEEACVRVFQAAQQSNATRSVETTLHCARARRHAPIAHSLCLCALLSLFYLPRFDDWWQQTSIPSLHPLRAALISCLRNLAAATSASNGSSSSARCCSIVLATSGCSSSHFVSMSVHPFLRDFFKSQHSVQFHAPNLPALNAFYTHAIRAAAMDIAQQIQTVTCSRQRSGIATESTGDHSADLLAAPSAAAPSSSSPSSSGADQLSSSLSSFLSRTAPCPLQTAALSLSRSSMSASLDFSALHRVHLEMDRWRKQQLGSVWRSLWTAHQSRKPTDAQHAPLDPALLRIVTEADDSKRASVEIPWADLIDAVADAAAATSWAVAADKSQLPSLPHTASDARWTAMAQRHAQALGNASVHLRSSS